MFGLLIQARMTSAAMRLRTPEMVSGCQSMILMNSPAMLQRKAAAAMAGTPRWRECFSIGRFLRSGISYNKYGGHNTLSPI